MTIPRTYSEAALLLSQARNARKGKPVANNTRLFRRSDSMIALRLHDTDVVEYHADGSLRLFTGGWTTVTTKDRINQALSNRAGVWSRKGRWYIGTRAADGWGYGEGVPFDEGITVLADGTVVADPEVAERVALEDRRNADMRRAVKRFVDGITPEQVVTALENPGGDCWGCMMVAEDGSYPMGEDCLAQHVQEGYFHAHLLLRALRAKGYRDPNVIMSMIYAEAKRGQVDRYLLKRNLSTFLRKSLTVGVVQAA